jgi:hypothetical protein
MNAGTSTPRMTAALAGCMFARPADDLFDQQMRQVLVTLGCTETP